MPGIGIGSVTRLWFGPGDPVRAASGVAPFGGGWIVVQDDANHAAWWRPTGVERVRLFPAVDGHDTFSEAAGTKTRKPDLEVACPLRVDGDDAVLLLGSGSLPPRTRGVLVQEAEGRPQLRTADLTPLYLAVAEALALGDGTLNLEGGCQVGGHLRWFQRGHHTTGVPSASVDVPLDELLDVFQAGRDPATIRPREVRRYDLGELDGHPLAITDAVTLPDGRILVAATAEDAPDAIADGPVAGSALGLLEDGDEVLLARLPDGAPTWKVEGLALRGTSVDGADVLAVVDQDDPEEASVAVDLHVTW